MKEIFDKIENLSKYLDKDVRYALITDTIVSKLYGKKLEKALKKKGFDVSLIVFTAGEKHKTRKTKEKIEDEMLAKKMGRDSAVIALGGGVVTDLAGFVAATYARGIPLISVPTTLLAMVDAAIGGKTGVNASEGKNLIGAYHPAKLVFIDLGFIKTLSKKEMKNGFAEIYKYGLIASKPLLELTDLKEIIRRSIAIKKKIVKADPKEEGMRRILNFGHTIGHALEKLLDYKIAHGEAVGAGMLFESYISMRMGYLSKKDFEKICKLLKDYKVPKVNFDELMKTIARDKKALLNEARFVLLDRIGRIRAFEGKYCAHVEQKLIEEAYEFFSH